jgi:hypothetical protein
MAKDGSVRFYLHGCLYSVEYPRKCLFNVRLHGNLFCTEVVSRNLPPWKRILYRVFFVETAYAPLITSILIIENGDIPEKLIFNSTLTTLIAQENVNSFIHGESFEYYKIFETKNIGFQEYAVSTTLTHYSCC